METGLKDEFCYSDSAVWDWHWPVDETSNEGDSEQEHTARRYADYDWVTDCIRRNQQPDTDKQITQGDYPKDDGTGQILNLLHNNES